VMALVFTFVLSTVHPPRHAPDTSKFPVIGRSII
jgi:hypothetical protein